MPPNTPPQNRRADDLHMAILAERIGQIQGDVAGMKDVLADLTKAINRLALIEERLSQSNAAQGRAFDEIIDLKRRLALLEVAAPETKLVNGWVAQVIGLLIAAAVGGLFTGWIKK